MTAREREAAALALVRRMTYQQATDRLGVSRSAVAGLVYRSQGLVRIRPKQARDDRWSDARLTERWADRQKRRDAAQAPR